MFFLLLIITKVISSNVSSEQVPFWRSRLGKQATCNTDGVSAAAGPQ